MPCRGPEHYHELSPEEIEAMGGAIAAQLSMLKGAKDGLYAALCEACRLAGDASIQKSGSAELRQWWTHHKQQDERRRAAEERARKYEDARQAALDKLTATEKRLLGIQ